MGKAPEDICEPAAAESVGAEREREWERQVGRRWRTQVKGFRDYRCGRSGGTGRCSTSGSGSEELRRQGLDGVVERSRRLYGGP